MRRIKIIGDSTFRSQLGQLVGYAGRNGYVVLDILPGFPPMLFGLSDLCRI